MLTVCKRFEFAYAHFLAGYKGLCKNMHGHTGILEVEVDGCGKCSDDKTIPGMIIDFSVLKNIVQTKVLERMDHQLINDLIQVPTAENMVHRIVELLSDTPLEGHLVRVRLYETPSAWAEWKRRS